MHRSILTLLIFLFASLATTIGYALLGLGGPETVLRKARHALDRDDWTAAIRHLDLVVHDVDGNAGGLLEDALRLRITAYAKLGLNAKVLEDIRLLGTMKVTDRNLLRTWIRTQNKLAREQGDPGRLEESWQIAERWLATHPKDKSIRAHAGATLDLRAELLFHQWWKRTRRQTPRTSHDRLRTLAHRAIYGVVGGRHAAGRLRTLTSALEELAPGSAGPTAAEMQRSRDLASRARGFYLRSLASSEPPLTAYEHLARQLRAAGDEDTLLMVAHNFRRRAAPLDGLKAAVDIADLHVQQGRYRAAVEIAERTLPHGTWHQRYLNGTLSHDALRLFYLWALALRGADDTARLVRMEAAFHTLINRDSRILQKLDAAPLYFAIAGVLAADPANTRYQLTAFLDTPERTDYSWKRAAISDTVYRRLLTVTETGKRAAIIRRWISDAPDAVDAYHALARLHLSRHEPRLAVPVLETALRRLPSKGDSLELLIQAQKALLGGDIDQVIHRATRLANDIPDEIGSFPALTFEVARRALALGSLDIALACCRRARLLFPETPLPRYLETEILLAMGRPGQAVQAADLLVENDRQDRHALALLRRARQAAGRPTDDLRFATILWGQPDLASCRFLARRWLARDHTEHVIALCDKAVLSFGPDLELAVLGARALMRQPGHATVSIPATLRAVYRLSRGTVPTTERERRLSHWALGQYISKNPEAILPATRAELLDEYLESNRSATDLESLAAELADGGEIELALRAYRDLTQRDRYKSDRRGTHFIAAGRLASRSGENSTARQMFSAAVAFPDGRIAILDVALLDQLQGDAVDIPKPPPVDSVFVACVLGDETALPFLTKHLAANPQDLATQCAAAALAPDTEGLSQTVVELARENGRDLRLLTALLEQPAYGQLAVARADAIAKDHPDNPVAQLLRARALANAHQPIGVVAALGKAEARLLEDPLLMETALEILASEEGISERYVGIRNLLVATVLRQGSTTPPAVLAAVFRSNPAVREVPGVRQNLLPLITRFWLEHTELSGAGLDEVALLVEVREYATAMQLLECLESRLRRDQRLDFLERYFSTAALYAPKATPPALEKLVRKAHEILTKEGVLGAPLHFVLGVLDDELRGRVGTPAAAATAERIRVIEQDYLRAHIDSFLRGQDESVAHLADTLARLGRRNGLAAALSQLDTVLRADPSLLRIWRMRANWLAQLDRIDEAIAALAWLPRFLDDPGATDKLVGLLGRAGVLVARGEELLEPSALARVSKLSLGLVQLRIGTYRQSTQALSQAEPSADGAHMYFQAMGMIALQNAVADAQARQLLLGLIASYPNSPFVESARLVVQLL